MGFKRGGEIKKILKRLSPEEQKAKLNEIKELVDTVDWRLKLRNNRYHIAKEYKIPDPNNKGVETLEMRESYIQMIDLPGISSFYEKLNSILGTNLTPPPAHITLFTKGDEAGIGINSYDELEDLKPEAI